MQSLLSIGHPHPPSQIGHAHFRGAERSLPTGGGRGHRWLRARGDGDLRDQAGARARFATSGVGGLLKGAAPPLDTKLAIKRSTGLSHRLDGSNGSRTGPATEWSEATRMALAVRK